MQQVGSLISRRKRVKKKPTEGPTPEDMDPNQPSEGDLESIAQTSHINITR